MVHDGVDKHQASGAKGDQAQDTDQVGKVSADHARACFVVSHLFHSIKYAITYY